MTTPRPDLPPVTRVPLEDPAAVRARARGRARLVGVLAALGLAAIAARGVAVILDPDPRTLDVAAKKRWRAVPVQGRRGAIVTADGTELAISVRHPSLFVDPHEVRRQATDPKRPGMPVAEVARRLADLLGRPVAEMEEVLARPGSYERLAEEIHPEVADRVNDLGLARVGVIVHQAWRRFYPQGTLAAQLVGFVDGDGVGQQGIEQRFHAELVGDHVVAQRRVDRYGAVLDVAPSSEAPESGNTVHLAIDRVVQQATQSALEAILVQSAPLSATAVVVDVHTGRVLAMATAPAFDPNRVDQLPKESFVLTQNLAVTGVFEPGSVIKPFTMAAGLGTGVVAHGTIFETGPVYSVGGKNVRDDHPHVAVTVDEMVKYSSNIAAAKIGRLVGEQGMLATFEAFGFGRRTGIDTQGELAGKRRPPLHFGPVELANVSFGQGMTTTALQLAMATAAMGNGGELMRPILVDRVTDAQGRVIQDWEPEVVGRAVTAGVAAEVTRAMEMVIEDGGTGTRAAVAGYRVAGKTGTAQKVSKEGGYGAARVSTFIGFTPSERASGPKLAMAIVVDEPSIGSRYGGIAAAPAFASVMGIALPHLGAAPDLGAPPQNGKGGVRPTLVSAVDPAEAAPVFVTTPVRVDWETAEGAWRMPDLAGRTVRDVLAGLQGLGVGLELEGSGRLVEQHPPVGAIVLPGETLRLRFR